MPRRDIRSGFWAGAFVLLFLGSAPAIPAPMPETTPERVGLSSQKLQRIDSVFEEGIADERIPGAVVAIARHGKLAYFKSFGMQNAAAKLPMRTDSIFRIYSMTKPIVSVGTMILHEGAELYLSEPVEKYLPELANMMVAKPDENPQTDTITTQRRTLTPCSSKIPTV